MSITTYGAGLHLQPPMIKGENNHYLAFLPVVPIWILNDTKCNEPLKLPVWYAILLKKFTTNSDGNDL